MNKNPLISIITVVFNARDLIERTIESTQQQTYANIEHLIIDGASNDGTTNCVEKNAARYANIRFISEPDTGLYDAMNKGLAMAKGEYVLFLNAGDTFADDTLIEAILAEQPGADIYYGQTIEVDIQGNFVQYRQKPHPDKLDAKSFQLGMLVSHQALLIKRSLSNKYDTKYRISADIDWVIHALKKANAIYNTNRVFCHYLIGGKSRKHIVRGNWERFLILCKHYGFINTLLYHLLILIRFVKLKVFKTKL